MQINLLKSLIASLALVLLSTPMTEAAVIVTLPTPTVNGSIVFTNDINFTVTASGYVSDLVFANWVTSNGGASWVSPVQPYLSFSRNGGSTITTLEGNIGAFFDNFARNVNALSPNDGMLTFATGISFAQNDVFTVKAATYTLYAGTLPYTFNPEANQTFTGDAFLTNSSGERVSADTPVGDFSAAPEPSRALLLFGGLILRRRRLM